MELRDIGRWIAGVVAIVAFQIVGYLLGIREPQPEDFDRACLISAFGVVLWAIRERTKEAE